MPASAIGLRNGAELTPLVGATGTSRVADGKVTLTLGPRSAEAFGIR